MKLRALNQGNVPIRVLQSFRTGRQTTNPYLIQLVESLQPEVITSSFSWQRAIFGRFDVIHLHWPENLVRGRGWLRTTTRRVLFFAMLARLSISRVALVRTLHNEHAHEQGGFIECALLGWCQKRTDLWIRLNPFTTPAGRAPVVTIPHGHYREWFARHVINAPLKGRLLAFGLIRPYKGVDRLLEAFRQFDDPKASLRIVGKPISDELGSSIIRQAALDQRVSVDLRYTNDSDLAGAVSESELIVLPYRAMHNSGAVLLALSLHRPVLVPENEINLALQREVGYGWVRTFTGDIDARDLSDATAWISSRSDVLAPDLSLREWRLVATQHLDAYRYAVSLRHSSRQENNG